MGKGKPGDETHIDGTLVSKRSNFMRAIEACSTRCAKLQNEVNPKLYAATQKPQGEKLTLCIKVSVSNVPRVSASPRV